MKMKRNANPLVSDDSVSAILQIATAYQKSKVLLTATELNIFTIINNDEKTSEEVAKEINADHKSLDRLLNALCALNLLEKDSDRFSNTKGTSRFLVEGRPEFLGDLMHISNLWDSWEMLAPAVKKGEPPEYKSIDEKDDDWVKSFVDSMHWHATLQAPDIVNMIDLDDCNKMLDLGCGSALYAMNFARKKPSMDIYAFDYPNVIKQTRTHLERNELQDKVQTIEGNFFIDDIGNNYDLIFISSIIQMYSIWDNIKLMQKCYDSLNSNGKVVIQDQIIDDDRTAPLNAALLSINMLVNTKGGDAYTKTDVWIMLKEAWFSKVEEINTPFGTKLIIGTK
ncbi:MAG: methyltransferase [Bacteroidota bacterium]